MFHSLFLLYCVKFWLTISSWPVCSSLNSKSIGCVTYWPWSHVTLSQTTACGCATMRPCPNLSIDAPHLIRWHHQFRKVAYTGIMSAETELILPGLLSDSILLDTSSLWLWPQLHAPNESTNYAQPDSQDEKPKPKHCTWWCIHGTTHTETVQPNQTIQHAQLLQC